MHVIDGRQIVQARDALSQLFLSFKYRQSSCLNPNMLKALAVESTETSATIVLPLCIYQSP